MGRATVLQKTMLHLLAISFLMPVPLSWTQEPQPREYTFKVRSELVLVNVVVRDKKGDLVRDLKRDDFTILEDNKPQRLLSFDLEQPDAPVESSAPSQAESQGPAETGPVLQPRSKQKDQSTVSLRDRRLLVLFFDFSGMEPEDIDRSVEAARTFVDKQMTPADSVAVVSFGSSLQVDQDFTSDRDLLRKALSRYTPTAGQGYEAGSTGDTEGTPDSGNAFTADDSDFNTFNTDRKLQALESLIEALARIEQKKSVIYFSNGVSRNGMENQSQLRSTINAATRANTAIYTLDTRGLQALPPGGDAQTASIRGVSAFSGASVRNQFDSNFGTQETLSTLASDTGGKAFLDSNDFSKIFDKVHDDTSAYYLLGYHSSNPDKDGRFRRITVKLNRPDLKLEYRKGYYAPRDFAHSGKEDRERQLEDEMAADLPSTDVNVYLAAAYFRMDDERYFVPVSLLVPGSEIPFVRAGDRNEDKATLDIMGVVREAQSKLPVANLRETVKLKVEGAQEVRQKNVQYNSGFVLAPGSYHMKFVVRENQTGKIGSFETDIAIPDLKDKSLKSKLKMSSLVLGSQIKPAAKAQRDNPLIRDGQELVPNITHVFTSDQHLYLYYEVYSPARENIQQVEKVAETKADKPKKNSVRVLSSLQFFQGKVKVFETPLVQVQELGAPGRQAAIFQLDVPLAKLAAGYYTCQLNVVDDAAGNFAFPRFPVLIKKKS